MEVSDLRADATGDAEGSLADLLWGLTLLCKVALLQGLVLFNSCLYQCLFLRELSLTRSLLQILDVPTEVGQHMLGKDAKVSWSELERCPFKLVLLPHHHCVRV
jgi:hypothetical protein